MNAFAPKTVLVVDDSPLMRRLVCEIVEADPDFRVVEVAENGKVALLVVCDRTLAALDASIATSGKHPCHGWQRRRLDVARLTADDEPVTLYEIVRPLEGGG